MRELLERSIALWNDCGAELPQLGREHSAAEQTIREKHLDRFFKIIESELMRLPRTRAERDRSRERITTAFMDFARSAVGMTDQHLHLLLEGGFSGIGTEKRDLDP